MTASTTAYPSISRFFGPNSTNNKRTRSDDDVECETTNNSVDEVDNNKSISKKRNIIAAAESNQKQDVIEVLDDSSIEEDDVGECAHIRNDDRQIDEGEEEDERETAQDINNTREEHQKQAEVVEPDSAKNPFSQFAFSAAGSPQKQGSLTKWMQSNANGKQPSNNKKKPRTFQSGGTEWIKMEDLPKHERDKIIAKWHGLVDPAASLEDRRFQVLVAARLHARCQEPVVRSAMLSLRNALHNDLSVAHVAQANPKDLAPAINNLQYYNTKALHIVKAAQEIKSQFGGVVPESEHLLKQLTGVGPVIADLLAFVNTRARHAATAKAAATTTLNRGP